MILNRSIDNYDTMIGLESLTTIFIEPSARRTNMVTSYNNPSCIEDTSSQSYISQSNTLDFSLRSNNEPSHSSSRYTHKSSSTNRHGTRNHNEHETNYCQYNNDIDSGKTEINPSQVVDLTSSYSSIENLNSLSSISIDSDEFDRRLHSLNNVKKRCKGEGRLVVKSKSDKARKKKSIEHIEKTMDCITVDDDVFQVSSGLKSSVQSTSEVAISTCSKKRRQTTSTSEAPPRKQHCNSRKELVCVKKKNSIIVTDSSENITRNSSSRKSLYKSVINDSMVDISSNYDESTGDYEYSNKRHTPEKRKSLLSLNNSGAYRPPIKNQDNKVYMIL